MRNDWKINRGRPHCSQCDRSLEPAEEYESTLVDDEEEASGFRRLDFCPPCLELEAPKRGNSWWWRTRVPVPKTDPRPRFDLDMAKNLVLRLQNTEDPRRQNLRYLIALYLMRRRKLRFENRVTEDESDFILGRLSGEDGENVKIFEPRMDSEATRLAQEDLQELFDT
ncbi:hypothetical protein JYT83_01065 [bacterium AH-315-F18]|nr:hypothetical protein [bacterium AH-315-F18]